MIRLLWGADNMGSKQRQQILSAAVEGSARCWWARTRRQKAIQGHLEITQYWELVAASLGIVGLCFTMRTSPHLEICWLWVPAGHPAWCQSSWKPQAGPEHCLGAQPDPFSRSRWEPTRLKAAFEIWAMCMMADWKGSSEATLLNENNISQGSHTRRRHGRIYNPGKSEKIIERKLLHSRFLEGRPTIPGSVCLQIGIPIAICAPFYIISGYKWVLACLWRLITPSHLLKRSRPSWLIYLHLWLRPPPQPRPRQGWNKGRVGGVWGGGSSLFD